MASVSTYLNFKGQTEAAFNFYKSVFGGDFGGPVMRFGDGPPQPGQPPLPADVAKQVMHMNLPILGGHILMGSDSPDMFGFKLVEGNNVYLNLEPDTRAEADRLFQGLSAGGTTVSPMAEMFWGAYYGLCVDKFGIQWSVNCMAK